jgi:hypothetical protein
LQPLPKGSGKLEKMIGFREYNLKKVGLKNGNHYIKSSLISRNRIVKIICVMQVKVTGRFKETYSRIRLEINNK